MGRIRFETWGRGVSLDDGYAIQREDETPLEAALRSIGRRTGLEVCGGPRREGPGYWAITLGRHERDGGWEPLFEGWISID